MAKEVVGMLLGEVVGTKKNTSLQRMWLLTSRRSPKPGRVQLRLYQHNYCVRYVGTDAVCTRQKKGLPLCKKLKLVSVFFVGELIFADCGVDISNDVDCSIDADCGVDDVAETEDDWGVIVLEDQIHLDWGVDITSAMSGFIFPSLFLNEDLTLRAAVATAAVNALSFSKNDVVNNKLFSLLRARIFSARMSNPLLAVPLPDIALVCRREGGSRRGVIRHVRERGA
jgi:hypothetical protein